MSDITRIVLMIRKLRAMTPENGCTEAEALAAAEKVKRLLDQYDLSDDDVDFYSNSVCLDRKRRQPMDGLWGVIAMYCECESYLKYDELDLLHVVYFGAYPKPLLAEYLHDVCQNALQFAVAEEKQTNAYMSRRKQRTRIQHLKAFQDGFIAALAHKLRRLKGGWNSKALNDARSALGRTGVELRALPALQRTDRRYDGSWVNGWHEGRKVELNEGVGGSHPLPIGVGHE